VRSVRVLAPAGVEDLGFAGKHILADQVDRSAARLPSLGSVETTEHPHTTKKPADQETVRFDRCRQAKGLGGCRSTSASAVALD
jgi:hypothetical protein